MIKFEQYIAEEKIKVELENKDYDLDSQLDTKADTEDEEKELTDIESSILNLIKDKYNEADEQKLIKDTKSFCNKLDKKYGEPTVD